LGQTMVDLRYCLDRVVPERMSQVWRRSEVRNHKRRSLNTRLSSGTSANTRNAPGRMIRSDLFWYGNNLKMKPTYREKNLLNYLFGGFRSTLNQSLAKQSLVLSASLSEEGWTLGSQNEIWEVRKSRKACNQFRPDIGHGRHWSKPRNLF